MRLGRPADRPASSNRRLRALLAALAAVTWVVVRGAQVGQAVVVAWAHVVDRVRAGKAAEVADVAVEGENGRPDLAAPVGGQSVDAPALAPGRTGHGELLGGCRCGDHALRLLALYYEDYALTGGQLDDRLRATLRYHREHCRS